MTLILTPQLQPYADRWFTAIPQRRSRRSYKPERPLTTELTGRMQHICEDFRPFPSTRAVFIERAPETLFWGIIGGYGKIKGATSAIIFIGNSADINYREAVGYTGEGIILEATSLGLATCWVGGFFRQSIARELGGLKPGERVLAVTPLGHAPETLSAEELTLTKFRLNQRRRPLDDLVTGINRNRWQEWVTIALEAARLAPSAMNRQPWGFDVQPDAITVFVRSREPQLTVSKRLDTGIAMLHIEVAALHRGITGSWEILKHPLVARFTSANNQITSVAERDMNGKSQAR